MSTTITLSSSLRPLSLLSSRAEKSAEPAPSDGSSANNTQLSTSSSSSSSEDDEAAAVDTLAQQLWDAGHIGEQPSTGVSSKLLFDTDALCDDAPYVCVDRVPAQQQQQHGAWRKRFAAACGEDGHKPRVKVPGPPLPSARRVQAPPQCSSPAPLCSPLIHPQPISNPFRTMMRPSGPPTASPTSLACQQPRRRERCASSTSLRPHPPPANRRPAAPPPLTAGAAPPALADPCIHCKRGNFLEFCFAADRCRCACHDACPCNPCLDIRRLRPSLTPVSAAFHPSASPSSRRLSSHPSRAQSTTASESSLCTAPSPPPACGTAALLDSAKFPDAADAHSAAWHQQLPSTAPLLKCSDNT
ncbi:hypothetical protein H4R20_000180 [Coemansia guatemalensis]|uniref:Uncharacterized protein n=1 Tax=Coemansia guatemalensis TaxID=2761395 RepID=A0A9W8LW51_9FUNG|nr:hypothetical protein H4R20_000180 [Coemansia guatemalensis]